MSRTDSRILNCRIKKQLTRICLHSGGLCKQIKCFISLTAVVLHRWRREQNILYRVWKSLSRIRDLKSLRESSKGKVQRRQYLLMMGLGHYKWFQSQTRGDVPVRRLSLEGDGHEVVCQQGCWAPKRGGLGVPHPHRLEKGTSVSKNAWLRGVWTGKGIHFVY